MGRKETLIHEIKRELVGQLVRDVERILLDATEEELEAYLSGLKAVSMTSDEIDKMANSYLDDYQQTAHSDDATQDGQNNSTGTAEKHAKKNDPRMVPMDQPSGRQTDPQMVAMDHKPRQKDIRMVEAEKMPPKKIVKNIPKPTEQKW